MTAPVTPTPSAPPMLTPGCIHTITSLALIRIRMGQPGPAADAAGWVQQKAYWQRTTPGTHAPRSYLVQGPPANEAFTVPNIYVDAASSVQTPASQAAWWGAVDPLMNDVDNAVWAALSWQLYHITADAETAARVLRAWSALTTVTGHDGPLVFASLGNGLILAADLISDYAGFTPALDRVIFRRMVRNVMLPQASVPIGVQKADNWRSISYGTTIMAWHHLGNADGIANTAAYGASLRAHIIASINSGDGKLPLEEARGDDSYWYTYFSLAFITMGMRAYRNACGVDLFKDATTGPLVLHALHVLLASYLNPLPGKSLPGPTDAYPYDLFEAMAAEYNDNTLRAACVPKRPINCYGHHIAWPSPTLTEATS